jgi:hypothetical protein
VEGDGRGREREGEVGRGGERVRKTDSSFEGSFCANLILK